MQQQRERQLLTEEAGWSEKLSIADDDQQQLNADW